MNKRQENGIIANCFIHVTPFPFTSKTKEQCNFCSRFLRARCKASEFGVFRIYENVKKEIRYLV